MIKYQILVLANNISNKKYTSQNIIDEKFQFVTIKDKLLIKKKGKKIFQRIKAQKKHQREIRDQRRLANQVVTGQSNFGGYAREKRNKWRKMKNQHWKACQKSRIENLFKLEPSLQQKNIWQQRNELWLLDIQKDLNYKLNLDSFSSEIIFDYGCVYTLKKNIE